MKSECNKMGTAENNYLLYGGEVCDNLAKRYKSLGEFYYHKLQDEANEAEIIDAKSGQRVTREEMRIGAEHLAEFLKQNGVQTGDVVTTLSENRLEFPVVIFSVFYCGASLNALSPYYTENEISHALKIVQPKIIFLTPVVLDRVRKVLQELNLKSVVIKFDEENLENSKENHVLNFRDIMRDIKYRPKTEIVPVKVNPESDVAFILMSSGTTGLPKCVQISHKNVLSMFSGTIYIFTDFRERRDNVLLITPWVHTFGLMAMLRLVACGVRTISIQGFQEKFYLQTIEDYKVSVCFVAPALMVFFSKATILDQYNLLTLRTIYSGGAPLSKDIVEGIIKRLPNVKVIYNGYGLTETSAGILHANSSINKLNSIGVLYRGAWGKVINPESGKALPPNTPGELCFKGDQIVLGYRGNAEATKNLIDPDGWLHSGDIGYYNEGREFFIIGRSKEVIKYKGFQVPPVELETVLLSHPKVRDAAVIGIPDEIAGELPMALVVRNTGVEVSDKELVDFVNSKVSHPKKLRGGVKFISKVSRNVNGKIMRQELKSRFGMMSKL
ncbi:luciferin 4-monooxygenase-like [Phlebotomus argentipes]|uniref:luciferin 4-monooxygenase-like n=1 Tax=Phlebotomus argentipes TaxID=94469 RepID=UPI00289378C9|nr:luciferin 4-monooxygenase-like [Phlebotomus argentipes]